MGHDFEIMFFQQNNGCKENHGHEFSNRPLLLIQNLIVIRVRTMGCYQKLADVLVHLTVYSLSKLHNTEERLSKSQLTMVYVMANESKCVQCMLYTLLKSCF